MGFMDRLAGAATEGNRQGGVAAVIPCLGTAAAGEVAKEGIAVPATFVGKDSEVREVYQKEVYDPGYKRTVDGFQQDGFNGGMAGLAGCVAQTVVGAPAKVAKVLTTPSSKPSAARAYLDVEASWKL